MIQLTQIEKRYVTGAIPVIALQDVDLAFAPAEYVALLGPSGSGKSTLLHLIGCLDRPTAGSYKLDGTEVSRLEVNQLAEIRRQRVGFVFQRFHLMPRLSALENVMLPMRLARVSPVEREHRSRRLLDRLGLSHRLLHRPAELSGGEQQRVAIARALANEPAMILADEPTGNLDSRTGREIMRLLEELVEQGTLIMVVTHDEALGARAHRVVRLADGRIVE